MSDIVERLRRGAAPLDDPDLNDQAADEIEALRKDAARYRWIKANTSEAPLNAQAFASCEFPDTRLRFVLPAGMVSWADYMGQRTLDEAIDAAMQANPTDAELERRTGEPHIDCWPLRSGLPPAGVKP